MAKTRVESLYICSSCGTGSHKWVGQCASCGAWNSLELAGPRAADIGQGLKSQGPRRLSDVSAEGSERYQTGLTELDRVLKPTDGLEGKYLVMRRGKRKYSLVKWLA